MARLERMNELVLLQGISDLAEQDADLAGVVQRYGPPPLWERRPGFPTLLHIILEQQVSLASAQAAFNRLLEAASALTPESFLTYKDEQLKAFGFSRQKAAYGRNLARLLVEKKLDLDALEEKEDGAARNELLQLKGVGFWTADIYLLMVLLRPDVWPHGDRALAVSVQRVKGLATCPSYAELAEMSAIWRPWRSVAARLFWHDYLSRPRQ